MSHTQTGAQFRAPRSAPAMLAAALTLLVIGLSGYACLSAATSEGSQAQRWLGMIGSLATLLIYGVGAARLRQGSSTSAILGWLAVLIVVWAATALVVEAAGWLAFAWYFVVLHSLPSPARFVLVAIVAVFAIMGFFHEDHQFRVGIVVGPALGAAVAVVTVLAYEALHRESSERLATIGELERTRADLAETQRLAGAAAERTRLSRELHDTVTQGLSSIQLLLAGAQRQLANDPTGAAEKISMARQAAIDNLAESRSMVTMLADGDQVIAGTLVQSIGRLVDRSGLDAQLRVDGDPEDLPLPVQVALLRIARTAISNATEHSAAEQLRVTISYAPDSVTLDIVDDGVGADPEALTGPDESTGRGFGLESIRERAAELGGTAQVETAPGEGFALVVELPLEPVSDD